MWPNFQWPTSKKARLVLAVLAFLTLLGVALFLRREKEPPPATENTASILEQQRLRLTEDHDNDGLKDWEEAIYRTNPQDPDSDGDGAKDGDEISQGRDPLKAGPEDQLVSEAPDASGSPRQDQNLTNRFIQLFGTKYFAQKINDPDQPLNVQEIANDIAQNIPSYQSSIQPFQLKDLTILKNSTPDNVKNWAKNFDAVNEEAFAGINEAEVSILTNALRTEDYSLLAKLDQHVAAYTLTLERMKKLPVPAEFASFQLRFMNIALELRELAQNFKKADKDVLAASRGVDPYLKLAVEMQTISQKVKQELKQRNIL